MSNDCSQALAVTSDKRIKRLAEKKSKEIIIKIMGVAERIEESKDAAERANEMKSGWWGKTGKKADATAEAVVRSNEAMVEMNNLIQESIRFTCTSVELSRAMNQTMAKIMEEGFKDTDGKIIQLSNTSKEFVEVIIAGTDNSSDKKYAIENLQKEFSRLRVQMKVAMAISLGALLMAILL